MNEEVSFPVSELFVSVTDKSGKILSGNDIFLRISGHPREELVGSAHNKVRHPDMPRCVFKILWDSIQQEVPLSAYIKNRCKDGRYYWVLASVFPVPNGHLSIRIKPTTDLLEKVKSLYTTIHQFEQSHTVEESEAELLKKLKALGHENYQEFMFHMLNLEITSRITILNQSEIQHQTKIPNSIGLMKRLYEMNEVISESTSRNRKSSKHLDCLQSLESDCQKQSQEIGKMFRHLENLSINMSIMAHRLATQGQTLSIVATGFQTVILKLRSYFDEFQHLVKMISASTKKIILDSFYSGLQSEMISFFIFESINSLQNDERNQKKIAHIIEETGLLLTASKILLESNTQEQKIFYNNIILLQKNTHYLKNLLTHLELIRTGGKLESSRSEDVSQVFDPFIKQMEINIDGLHGPIQQFSDSVAKVIIGLRDFLTDAALANSSFTTLLAIFSLAKKYQSNKNTHETSL